MDLHCESDWKDAATTLADKAPFAQTWAVAMEVKDMVSNKLSL